MDDKKILTLVPSGKFYRSEEVKCVKHVEEAFLECMCECFFPDSFHLSLHF